MKTIFKKTDAKVRTPRRKAEPFPEIQRARAFDAVAYAAALEVLG
jgi:hypothetical protein